MNRQRWCLLLLALQSLLLAWLVVVFRGELHQKVASRVQCRYLFIGDSMIAQAGIWGWWWGRLWPDHQNFGRGGADLFSINATAREVVPVLRPDTVVLMGGFNDTARHDLPTMISDYTRLLASIQATPEVHHLIVVSTLPDVEGRALNSIQGLNDFLHKSAREHGFSFLDLRPQLCDSQGCLRREFTRDGLHLNQQGYREWVRAMLPLLAGP